MMGQKRKSHLGNELFLSTSHKKHVRYSVADLKKLGKQEV